MGTQRSALSMIMIVAANAASVGKILYVKKRTLPERDGTSKKYGTNADRHKQRWSVSGLVNIHSPALNVHELPAHADRHGHNPDNQGYITALGNSRAVEDAY